MDCSDSDFFWIRLGERGRSSLRKPNPIHPNHTTKAIDSGIIKGTKLLQKHQPSSIKRNLKNFSRITN